MWYSGIFAKMAPPVAPLGDRAARERYPSGGMAAFCHCTHRLILGEAGQTGGRSLLLWWAAEGLERKALPGPLPLRRFLKLQAGRQASDR